MISSNSEDVPKAAWPFMFASQLQRQQTDSFASLVNPTEFDTIGATDQHREGQSGIN